VTERRIYSQRHIALLPEALEACASARDGAANASSTHRDGQRARLAIEEAREDVAGLAGVLPSEIAFTSGGTEAANAAILGSALALTGGRAPDARIGSIPEGSRGVQPDRSGGARWSIVSTTIEHPAVHRALRGVERLGFDVRRIAPRPEGVLDAEDVLEAVDETTVLVSVMYVNNEIGTVQPVDEIAATCAARGIPVHSDAVQSLGRIPLPLRASLLGLSAHKIGGPQGVGALIVRKGVALEPLSADPGDAAARRHGEHRGDRRLRRRGASGPGAARPLRAPRRRAERASRSGPVRTLPGSDDPRSEGPEGREHERVRAARSGWRSSPRRRLSPDRPRPGGLLGLDGNGVPGKTGPVPLEALGAPEDVARIARVSLGVEHGEESIRLLGALEAAWKTLKRGQRLEQLLPTS
jgi:hypothetical protein